MPNEIDLVVGQVAFDKITELIGRLKDVDTEFSKIADKFSNLGKTGNPQSTAELAKLTAENQKLNKALNDLKSSYTTIDTELAKNTKLITDNTLATKAQTAAETLKLKATEDQNSAYVKSAGLYANLDAQHKLAVKNAQDLAVATGRTGEKYEEAKNKANELGNRLRVIDTDIGKHTRNVGNYSSSWNGLGNSINQLTREAPAFANSVQTGFMALSNNIPILTDELGVLIQKNKDLQKEGKPTQSILKTVAGAFFSWQTAISLGVTILTVYGAKLWDMVSGLDALKRKQEAFEISQKLMDDQIEQTTRNILHQGKMRKDAAILAGASADDIRAIDLQTQKDVQANLVIVNESNKRKYENSKKYADAKIRMDELTSASSTLSSKTEIQRAKEQQEYYKNLAIVNKYKNWKESEEGLALKRDAYDKSNKALVKQGFIVSELLSGQKVEEFNENKKFDKIENKSAEEKSKAEKERIENEFKGDIADLENKKEIAKDRLDLFKGEVKDKIALSMNLASKEIDLAEKVYEYNLFLAGEDTGLRKKALAERSKAVRDSFKENVERAGDFYSDFFKKADDSLPKSLFGDKYKMTDEQKADLKAHEDYIKKTLNEIQNYLGSFTSELGSNLGFKETFDFFLKVDEKGKNMWQKLDQDGVSSKEKFATRFNAIAESAQEAFNFISNISQENIKNEYERLDKQKEVSLSYAGDSVAAKEKIEEDYNKKKNEIAKKEAKAKKEQAIMNIAIDTAQAIMGLWVKPGFPAAIPMAIAVGALGAIQIGMVASQKLPQYAEGTDNHSGGLMLVNDGSGNNYQEKVILPSGKVIRPQGRNVLMDAPKGTKVLNHEQQLFEMLQSNNISMSSPQYQGMTPDEMDEILGKHFGNIKTQNTIFDKNGFQTYVRNGNSITRSNSNRSQAIGISV
jgi:hypothetical protein